MLQTKILNPLKVVRWRRFDRKGYSAFRSIGRIVSICTVTVSTLSSATAANPQESDSMTASVTISEYGESGVVELADVEVTASLKSLAAGRTSRIVTIITPEEIQASSAQSIPDILKLASQVDVRQRGNFGVQTDISIDGGTFDQVTILLNGVNITSPQIGHYSADWPVDIKEIVRVEVLEGAASRISGGSSLMGAINIVTKPSDEKSLYATAEGGSYGSFGAAAIASQASTTVQNQLSGSYRRSDGGTTNSAFDRAQAFYQGSFTSKIATLNWQAGISALDHGANTFYSAAYPNQHDNLHRYIASVAADIRTPIRLEPIVYWHRLKDHYQLIYNTPKGENFHRTDVYGGRLNASKQWVAGATTVGAEYRHEAILSTNLGSPHEPVKCNDSINYIYGDSRSTLSLYLEHSLTVGRWSLSAGFVAARNSSLEKKFRFYPGIDVSYSVSRNLRAYATWSRAYRLPTFTDLYYKSPTHEGNKSLKIEEMQSYQVGVTYASSLLTGKVYGFYHRGHNMLDWVMYSADDVFHSTGFDLRNIGFGVQGELLFEPLLGKKQPLKILSVGYTNISQHRYDDQVIYKSNYALEYLRHKFTASLHHSIVKNLYATWAVRWQKRNGSYIVYENHQATGTLRPYKAYALLDLKLQYMIRDLELYVNATNLTDVRYQDLGSIPQPGLWIMAGASITLK